MKVMCIANGHLMIGVPPIYIGTTYTVDDYVDKSDPRLAPNTLGCDYFILEELGPDNAYAEILFAPLNTIEQCQTTEKQLVDANM